MESIYTKLGRLTEQISDAGKFAKYREASANCTSVESKVACAESILRIHEANRPIVKNNGRHEFLEILESSEHISEAQPENEYAETDRVICESLGFSEEQKRNVLGLRPTDIAESQREEYDFLRAIRISDADARRLLKEGYKF